MIRTFMHSLVDFQTSEYLTFSVWVEYDEKLETVLTHTVQDICFRDKQICLLDSHCHPLGGTVVVAYNMLRQAGLPIDNDAVTYGNKQEVLEDNVRKFRAAVRDAVRFAEALRKSATSKINVMERNTSGGAA